MNTLKNKRILITCGPTWVPIDDVRVISNISSGRLGQRIAEDLLKERAKVTLIEGPVATPLKNKSLRILKFHYFDEMFSLIQKELTKDYDIMIHAAAVSDYHLDKPFDSKLSSQLKRLTLELVPTKKIIQLIKKLNPKIFLVGFKLASVMDRERAQQETEELVKSTDADLVIANSAHDNLYSGFILNKQADVLTHQNSREKLSKALVKILKNSST